MNLKFHVSNTFLCYMLLGMWAEVKVYSYHALTHVCVGSCMCCAQATPTGGGRLLGSGTRPPPPPSLPFGPT